MSITTVLWLGFLIGFVLWVGIGYIVLRVGTRSRFGDHLGRSLDRRVCNLDHPFEVSLTLNPPTLRGEVPARDVILCFDESGSMGMGPGSPLQDAIRAGEIFVRRCPAQINLGIVRFSHDADISAQLGSTRRQVIRAIRGLGSGGGTAIHEALAMASEALERGRKDVPKTIVLLSDGGSPKGEAKKAKIRLLEAHEDTTILCVGLRNSDYSAQFHEDILRAIADCDDHCMIIDSSDQLAGLFEFLSSYVSGGSAISGVVEEEIPTPHPFQLKGTAGLAPFSVFQEQSTYLTWAMPIMGSRNEPLIYRLVPHCCGWQRVTRQPGRTRWSMPDGSKQESKGPPEPRILVLPTWLRWAWPIFNPLFFMLFGSLVRRFFCKEPYREPLTALPVVPLEPRSLPAALPLPGEVLPAFRTHPALILGIGKAGIATLSHLKQLMLERGIPDDHWHRLNVDVASQGAGRGNLAGVMADNQVLVGCDLRPYLERMRDGKPSASRAWIPWRRWLAEPDTLNTRNRLNDRRKARLSLLLNGNLLEEAVRGALEYLLPLVEKNESRLPIYLVGEIENPAFSGLVSEVGHMLATQGQSASLVMMGNPIESERSADVAALIRELERLVLLGGDDLISDRQEPPVSATHLFDHLFVVPSGDQQPRACLDALWPLLAYPAVHARFESSLEPSRELEAWRLEGRGFHVPIEAIWQWVLTRTLSQAVLLDWLAMERVDGQWRVVPADKSWVGEAAERFWSGEQVARSRPAILGYAIALMESPNPARVLLEAADAMPLEEVYSEQVAFWRVTRTDFVNYCEAWLHGLLQDQGQRGHWGVLELHGVITTVIHEFDQVRSRIDGLNGDGGLMIQTNLVHALLQEMIQILEQIATAVSEWVSSLVGPILEQGIAAPSGGIWLVNQLEERRRIADERFHSLPEPFKQVAGRAFDVFSQDQRANLVSQLSMDVIRDAGGRIGLHMRLGDHELTEPETILIALEAWISAYRVQLWHWPWQAAIKPLMENATLPLGRDSFGLGVLVEGLRSDVVRHDDENDPFFAGVFRLNRASFRELCHGSGLPRHDLPFVWPEEQQAANLAERLQHWRQEEVVFTNPRVVNALGRREQFTSFCESLVLGELHERAGEVWLSRDGRDYGLADAWTGLEPLEAMVHFEDAIRQAVILAVARDGQAIPERSEVSEALVMSAQGAKLLAGLRGSPKWREWQDAINGSLGLE